MYNPTILKEDEYIVNMRFEGEFYYKPILQTDRKNIVIRCIKDCYENCKDVMFRVDSNDSTTFINRVEDLEYFDDKCKRLKK